MSAVPGENVHLMSQSRVRIVVVDDREDVRDLLRLRLERTGHFDVVGEGSDGYEAIDLCTEHHPDVVIVDAAMPGLNGLEAVPDIARVSPVTAIVIYTAESGLATRNEAERVGAHAVVGKLDPFERLVETIFRLVPQFTPVEPPPDPGLQRIGALLTVEPKPKPLPKTLTKSPAKKKSHGKFIVLAFLVLLPGLAFLAWILAGLSGLMIR